MSPYLAHFLALITTTIAIPLNSQALSSSTPRNLCSGTPALLDEEKLALPEDDAIEMSPDKDVMHYTEMPSKFTMKRSKSDSCKPQDFQPAVRLSAYPDTGTTWIQYLVEEATKVATQSPSNIVKRNKGTKFLPDEEVTCRAECGAQIYLHRNCTAGSVDANNVTLATGATPEIYKNHYPDFMGRSAMFETPNVIQKTILLTRNPVDAYLAQTRHTGTTSSGKVGATADTVTSTSENCVSGFTSMRRETQGRGIDPLRMCNDTQDEVQIFDEYIPMWCEFFTFWLTHASVGCTEVVVVRYEDLATSTGDVLETILQEAGLSTEGINRSVMAYPPSADKLSNDVYFNKTLHEDNSIKHMASIALEQCGDRVNDFGYMPYLRAVLEH